MSQLYINSIIIRNFTYQVSNDDYNAYQDHGKILILSVVAYVANKFGFKLNTI